MRHLKKYEGNWLGNDGLRKSEILISQIYRFCKLSGRILPPNRFKFYEDFNDRHRDESEIEYPPLGIETQYGDFFIIFPNEIKIGLLGLMEVLLKAPFNGRMYVSGQDHRLQVRIYGNGQWTKINRGNEKYKKV